MKNELDLAKQLMKLRGIHVRDVPDSRVDSIETITRRRMTRVDSDDFLTNGLWADNMVALSTKIARLAITVASTLAQFGLDPDINNFAEAVTDLTEKIRGDLDKALLNQDWALVMRYSIELEIMWYGVCGSLSIPYYNVLESVHADYMKGEPENPDAVRELLASAGLLERK